MQRIKLKGNEKVLIVRPDRIGDLVLTLPLAQVLRDIHPGLTIDFLVSSYNSSVLEYAVYIDNYLMVNNDDKSRKSIASMINEIVSRKYDVAIFAKPDLFTSFCIFMSDIKYRIGTSRRGYSFLYNMKIELARRHANTHEQELNLRLLEPFGLKYDDDSITPSLNVELENDSISELIPGDFKYIVVHPGSKGSAANWPTDNYVKLINRLSESRNVVITGQGKSIGTNNAQVIDLVNKTGFDQLISILNNADLFISGSTGPLHIAAALGVPSLGLYPDHPVLGPHRWGPRGKKAAYIEPPKQSGHRCRINDNGSCECMAKITVDDVYHKALEMLGQGVAAR